MADEEYQQLVDTLKEMHIKPKADTPEALQQWIEAYAIETLQMGKQTQPIKKEPSTSTSSHYTQPPRINLFSGSGEKKGGETTYELWKYEVLGLMKDKIHSEEAIIQAIRRALRGEAGLVAMRLGTDASLTEIMSKMESVFGNVDELETIMSDFYNAKQKETEDVSAWSCRLEGILDKAIHSWKVSKPQADTMMHDMLWKGLRPDIKHISHYEKERFKTFDHLRVALRKIEKEHNLDELPKVKATSKQAIANDMNEKEEESELVTTLKQINTRLEQLESRQHNKQQFKDQPNQQQQDTQPQPYQETFNQFRGRGYNRGGRGNRGYDRGYARGYGRGNGRGFGQNQHQSTQPITCYRCGRDSHIARGCRANTDVNGKPLN
ncbi:Hypothetical predicted protein [Mytilus galloprovincialis]|uniref:CCHC-type domain-containing protein n=1 Tax=Mytilus galloprovincialis TaxID=29158 RepID=A0A8B6CEW1_MYTGA|nr:Hypothetical predicted protein [Mytilus galloprovincialis]